MASIYYLWSNRAKFPFSSGQFFKAWGKRFLCGKEMISRNHRRRQLVRKGAVIHATAEIGKLKADGMKENLRIGAFSFIGNVNMALHHEIHIGANVCINDDVRIFTASHDVLDPCWNHTKGKVIIEDFAWIGTGSYILPGVRIGRGAVVGAGAVVSKSVAPGEIVVGNPAKPTGKRRPEHLNYNPCEFLAANRAWLKG